jgi:hypothetical protein
MIGNQGRAGDAHRRGNEIPADDRPRLRERTGRHSEEQHGRGAHRRDEKRNVRRGAEQQKHGAARERDAEERA